MLLPERGLVTAGGVLGLVITIDIAGPVPSGGKVPNDYLFVFIDPANPNVLIGSTATFEVDVDATSPIAASTVPLPTDVTGGTAENHLSLSAIEPPHSTSQSVSSAISSSSNGEIESTPSALPTPGIGHPQANKSMSPRSIAGISAGAFFVLILPVILWFCLRCSRRWKRQLHLEPEAYILGPPGSEHGMRKVENKLRSLAPQRQEALAQLREMEEQLSVNAGGMVQGDSGLEEALRQIEALRVRIRALERDPQLQTESSDSPPGYLDSLLPHTCFIIEADSI
ncbi:hypothetical protein MVEN_02374600 [Mycena venus]|uniref:Uncharacterized protein n=1 Tax=Mycena venus TaxID=2733690 RepID=A0A8H6X2Y3_9AGAR|nr:hypothetical protein MVEN_02374600 [Mycena venus]